jgi:hypothetical protein
VVEAQDVATAAWFHEIGGEVRPEVGFPMVRPLAREITIVVRIREGSADRARNTYAGPCFPDPYLRVLPDHAITPQSATAGGPEAVAQALRRKLLELHEQGLFEVTFDWLPADRAEVSVNYEPIDPHPSPMLSMPWCGPPGRWWRNSILDPGFIPLWLLP